VPLLPGESLLLCGESTSAQARARRCVNAQVQQLQRLNVA